MPDTPKQLTVLLTAVEQTVYTVPAATTAIIKMMTFANSLTSGVKVKASKGADAVGTRLVPNVLIPAETVFDRPCWQVLETGQQLRAQANAANAVALTIDFVEVT